MYIILKTLISAIIIVAVSEIAKKYTWTAAIIVSLPLTSLLAFVWLYWDTKDSQKVIELSYSTIVMTVPSIVFFIVLPTLLKFKQNFVFSLIVSIISTAIAIAVLIIETIREKTKFCLNFRRVGKTIKKTIEGTVITIVL